MDNVLKLQNLIGGQTDLYYDLITSDEIIMINKYHKWSRSFSKLLVDKFYPNHTRVIYLFDVPEINNLDCIEKILTKYEIKLKIINP